MATYIVGHLTVDDADGYTKYAAEFFPILKKYDGELLLVDDDAECVEGTFTPGRLVILKFNDKTAADRWYRSPEYQSILKHRLAASHTHWIAVGETSPEMAEWVASEMSRPAAT